MLNNHKLVRTITESAVASKHPAVGGYDGEGENDWMRKAAFGAVMLAGSWLLVGASAIASTEIVGIETARTEATVDRTMIAQAVAAAPREYQTLYVNPEIGNDGAQGIEAAPLRTVTRALEIAESNTVIVLAPGRYSQASGEVFPLQLRSGVTIQGAPGSRDRSAIIEGGGTFESPTRSQQNAAIIAADRAGIAQIAISNPDGYGVWVESASPTILETAFVGSRQTGIYVTGGSPRVQNNYFSGNQVAGLIIFGVSSASVASNTFDGTGDAIRVAQGATPEIVGNRIVNNNAGLVLVGDVGPVVRNNQIVGNRQNEVRVSAGDREFIAAAPADLVPERVVPIAKKVPLSADAVPGESLGSLPMLASALPVTAPSQTIAAVEPISRPLVTSAPRMPLPPLELIPAEEPVAGSTVEPTDAIAAQSTETISEPLLGDPSLSDPLRSGVSERVEIPAPPAGESESALVAQLPPLEDAAADDDRESIPAGSPGAALAALRSGVSSGVSSGVALAPRAVSGENPDSPVLRRRRERRNREEVNPDTIENRNNPTRQPLPPANSDRLSVPSSRIPLGSGSSSTIFSPPTGGVGGPPAPPSRAQALGLFYRGFVETSDPFEQDEVREVIGDAFRTRFEGRTVMQVGAFPTEEEAEERQRILEDNGFNARIEFIR